MQSPFSSDPYAWLSDEVRQSFTNGTAALSLLQASGQLVVNGRRDTHALCTTASLPHSASSVMPDHACCNSACAQEENVYTEWVLEPSQQLQQQLRDEMLRRLPEEKSSVPQVRCLGCHIRLCLVCRCMTAPPHAILHMDDMPCLLCSLAADREVLVLQPPRKGSAIPAALPPRCGPPRGAP